MIEPAGHGSLDRQNHEIDSSGSELEDALLEWASMEVPSYEKAVIVLQGIRYDVREIQKVVSRHMSLLDRTGDSSSSLFDELDLYRFLNAGYNLSEDRYIHHSFKSRPMKGIGTELPNDKLLYVSEPTDSLLGVHSHGVIVNSEPSASHSALDVTSKGIFIQAAPSGEQFGSFCKGVAIALEEPESYGAKAHNQGYQGLVVTHDKITPLLRKYCHHLIDICNRGEDAVFSEFGDNPADKIRGQIYNLVVWWPPMGRPK